MKILKLQLENINALKDKWLINFDDEAFSYGGIFTIIGQTGAGKTTILDAICLALYGATPRLGKITKSDNALMHLGTAICSAQVWLSIHDKEYHFYFSQHRARMKSDGALQDPKREISIITAAGNQILAEKNTHIDALAVQILGMDFAQFTRSVMLAQGSFAAFLQSNSHHRGEILEKITGTEIYAKLGELAHRTYQDKLKYIKEKRTHLDGINLVSNDKLTLLAQSIAQITKTINNHKAELDHLDKKIALKNNYEKIYSENIRLTSEYQHAKQALDDFAKTDKALQVAQRLLPLENDFEHLKLIDKHLNEEKAEYNQNINKLAHAKDNQTKVEQVYLDAKTHHDNIIQSSLKLADTIKKVREMDMHINFLDIESNKIQKAINKQQQEIDHCQTKQQKNTKAIIDHQKVCAELTDQLTKYQELQDLSLPKLKVDIERWITQLSLVQSSFDDLHIKQQHTTAMRTKQDNAKQKNHTHKIHITKLYQTQAHVQGCLLELFDEEFKKYDDKTKLNHAHNWQAILADYHQNYQRQQQIAIALNKDIDDLKQQQQAEQNDIQEKAMLIDKRNKNRHLLTQSEQDMRYYAQLLLQNERELATAKSHHELLLQFDGLQAYFFALTTGDPCPLCGATDHPYQDNHPHFDDNQNKLTHSQKMLEKLEKERQSHQHFYELAQNQMQSATINDQYQSEKIDVLTQKIIANQSKQEQLWQTIQSYLTADFYPIIHKIKIHYQDIIYNKPNADMIDFLSTQLEIYLKDSKQNYDIIHQTQQELNQIASNIVKAENDQRIFIHDFDQCCHAYKQAKSEWISQKDKLCQQLDALTMYSKAITTQITFFDGISDGISDGIWQSNDICYAFDLLDKLAHLVHNIDKNTLPHLYQTYHILNNHQQAHQITKQLNAFYQNLENLSHIWQTNQKTLQKHQAELGFAYQNKKNYQAEFDQKQQHLAELIQEKNTLDKKLATKKQERFLCFGDDNPDKQEQIMKNKLNDSQEHLEQAQKKQDTAQQVTKQLEHNLQQQSERISTLKKTQQKKEQDFYRQLDKFGLKDKADYLSYRLDHATISQLQDKKNQLNNQLSHFDKQLALTQKTLDELTQTHPNMDKLELSILQSDKQNKQDTLNQLLTKLGADKQRYKDAQDAQENAINAQADIERCEKEIEIWAYLARLIGSHDGKTYRNFAQGLTLDVLLVLANQVLIKMNDRYELIRSTSEKNILGIDVKDKYQNDTIRSSKNLSGGESFIVSLALALALSNIHSQKMQIESLFLDEGFGTLDEEALDIALSTLSEIEQTGKKIGIISHVSTLKERISTQILVEKKSNGVSTLKGAGVVRLNK